MGTYNLPNRVIELDIITDIGHHALAADIGSVLSQGIAVGATMQKRRPPRHPSPTVRSRQPDPSPGAGDEHYPTRITPRP
ncbi:hypothetical protein HNP40_001897 [Mycobacteroides chelonae]|nr:hypothetical protein [Mycobacteroides chelonae]